MNLLLATEIRLSVAVIKSELTSLKPGNPAVNVITGRRCGLNVAARPSLKPCQTTVSASIRSSPVIRLSPSTLCVLKVFQSGENKDAILPVAFTIPDHVATRFTDMDKYVLSCQK